MTNPQKFLYPKTIDEALEMLASPDSCPIAGGSDLSLQKSTSFTTFVDITRLPINGIIEKDEFISIGATSTFNDLDHPLVKNIANGLLSSAASKIMDTPLRHQVTVGGNIVGRYWWSSLPVVFLALDGKIVLQSKEETRTLTTDEFFEKRPVHIMSKNELVTEILIPKEVTNYYGDCQRFSVTEAAHSIVCIATSFKKESNVCSNVRIVAGNLIRSPKRLTDLEEMLEGKELTQELIDEISQEAGEKLEKIRNNEIASGEYRKEILKVLVKRALEGALN
ncbi:MAG: FAD binding domain-containing protein [Candidatus Heimdallarchaeota archaeon]|nr:FAD binding domain-containing protein [Candidatus Heimdallarchaeota archaeon]MCK5048921.1 FAD binding domain-containing protein [Candidatus Heimdallarchaeota archaeon]